MGIAGIFPGQGSQSVGMLAELAQSHAIVRETFEEASDILTYDLWECVSKGPVNELNKTENTQPAMLAADIAVWRVWLEKGGVQPNVMAGHSLGEYSALVAANSISFSEAVLLVRYRAEYMQNAVAAGVGGMAAILGLDNATIERICGAISEGGIVQPVNYNAPGQVVIAGNNEAVELAVTQLKEAGAKRAIKLSVSVPSHCQLMTPAAERLNEILLQVGINIPEIVILHNIDGLSRHDDNEIRQALSKQLYNPVRWVDTVLQFQAGFDADTVIEFGPGKILTGLNKRIDRSLSSVCIMDDASLEKAFELSA